jgi:CNT family concentrative nucleoside transporter
MVSFLPYFIDHNRYLNIVGIAVILGIAVLFSHKRAAIDWKLIIKALLLQCGIALLMLKTSVGVCVIGAIARGVTAIYRCADEGIGFVFGNLANTQTPWGFIFAFKVLPVMVFFGALTALLFHWGIVQRVVSGVNVVLRPVLDTSGAETVCAIANSFLGQTESPLLIRNYLKGMTKSELFVVMVSGMATISGSILVVYAAMGVPSEHLLASSIMSIPGAILLAKIMMPETDTAAIQGHVTVEFEKRTSNALDAISRGTSDGLQLAVNVGAMLIVFISLIALIQFVVVYGIDGVNYLSALFGSSCMVPVFTLDMLFGYIFAPFGFLLGFEGSDIFAAGQLLGTKVAINELIAYKKMLAMNVSPRTLTIMTYVLCGFSNFSSIGIQIGGIGALVPEKRHWLTELGPRALIAAMLANLLSAMVVSILI